ncbi:hemin uptake protein HemP [Stutzerimonas nitrititolerans]|uniref:hemin uptake protein HemP n=1 Tax=Stutzerimonas nitrititolerans TaxID=2482751 RepID=UPI002897AB73|nr:hemin uptake protein HemP [Stutzerimonas nitrititolerans]
MELQQGYGAVPETEGSGRSDSAAAPRRTVLSEQLLKGARELVILHDGCEYVLRLTRQNKLILTK